MTFTTIYFFGNSILATRQIASDLFPARQITIRKLGLTYAAMNLLNPWFGGVPTCHGSGGMAGHYTFGARTGGSVIIYGLFYLVLLLAQCLFYVFAGLGAILARDGKNPKLFYTPFYFIFAQLALGVAWLRWPTRRYERGWQSTERIAEPN